mmetsp:Transcript_15209/g.21353  ORF Transcript_15209/g.21353 Transcript_15209/m.21353 type:complete len:84 (+) Transcript_15209:118-369(+)
MHHISHAGAAGLNITQKAVLLNIQLSLASTSSNLRPAASAVAMRACRKHTARIARVMPTTKRSSMNPITPNTLSGIMSKGERR